MIGTLVGSVLLSLALAAVAPVTTGAAEAIVHRFRCPAQVAGRTAFDAKIGSDPAYSLKSDAHPLEARFVNSFRTEQRVGCIYRDAHQPTPRHADLVYSYTVQRQIVSCQYVGQVEFLCLLK